MSSAFKIHFFTGLVSLSALAQPNNTAQNDFDKPFPAHKVIGNVYFVGTAGLGSYLITTPEGHFLVNSDFERTVPQIRASVEKLGFKFTDIKIILGSHAHGDHMEGDALAKELSGARVMAMDRDVPALQKMMPAGKPHPIDRILHDGDQVSLGNSTLTAHLTAGHTKGCTTWSTKAIEAGKPYDVVIVCSVGFNPGYVLVNNKDYPQIADDYVRSFATQREQPCDVFIAAHGQFYGLEEKYAKLGKTGPNPFIDHAGYLTYIDLKEQQFRAELERQKKGGKPQSMCLPRMVGEEARLYYAHQSGVLLQDPPPAQFYNRVRESLPDATLVNRLPISGGEANGDINIDGRPAEPGDLGASCQ